MTAPDVNADVRARFEAWARPQGYRMHIRDVPGAVRFGQYCDDTTQAAFEAYRAAHADRDAEVRELVEVCQDIEPWLAKHIVGGQLANRLRAALAKFTQEKP